MASPRKIVAMNGAPDGRRFSLRECLVSLSVLWLIWAIARWPAFVFPFWAADDFSNWDFTIRSMLPGAAAQGRVLDAFYYALSFPFPPPDHLHGTVILRCLSGALHAAGSVILLSWLIRWIGRPAAWCAILPFHLWAFNSEATLWFSGSTYAFSFLCSVGGVALIASEAGQRGGWRPVAGAFLIVCAINLNQAPSTAGACFWLIIWTFRVLQKEHLGWGRCLREASWVAAGYIVGGGLSLWCMKAFEGSRLTGEVTVAEKLNQLGNIWERLWLFPGLYPLILQVAYVALLLLAVIAAIRAVLTRGIAPWQAAVLALLWLALAIAPYGANLVSPDTYYPVRILYAGTLIWVALAAWVFWWARDRAIMRATAGVLVGLIAIANVWLGSKEAADFSAVYRKDLETLRRLEAFAAERGTDAVLFMDWWNSSPWQENPYDLDLYYPHAAKVTVFQKDYWSYRFLDYYSDTLRNTEWWPVDEQGTRWDRLRRKYSDLARSLPRDEWIQFVHIEEENLILVVPR